MKSATAATLMLIRVTGVVLIILGAAFWTGHAFAEIPLHKQVGYLFVLSLWTLAALAARAGVAPSFVSLAVVWGLAVAALGMTQDRLLIGNAHWVIKVLHLLVGLGAMGLAEGLAARSKQTPTPALQR
jgi:hypothetical protein